MDEKIIKETVKKMFATGEIQVGVNISDVDENELRITVFITDGEEDVLQSATDFYKKGRESAIE